MACLLWNYAITMKLCDNYLYFSMDGVLRCLKGDVRALSSPNYAVLDKLIYSIINDAVQGKVSFFIFIIKHNIKMKVTSNITREKIFSFKFFLGPIAPFNSGVRFLWLGDFFYRNIITFMSMFVAGVLKILFSFQSIKMFLKNATLLWKVKKTFELK